MPAPLHIFKCAVRKYRTALEAQFDPPAVQQTRQDAILNQLLTEGLKPWLRDGTAVVVQFHGFTDQPAAWGGDVLEGVLTIRGVRAHE